MVGDGAAGNHGMIQVREPVTGVAVAPTVVSNFDPAFRRGDGTGTGWPATLILRVTADLNILTQDGHVAGTLDEVMADLAHRVIPAFFVEAENEAAALEAWLAVNRLHDAFIMSGRGELVRRIRQRFPLMRGVLDCRDAPGSLAELRRNANLSLARVMILPQQRASRRSVSTLQRLLMTVWVREDPEPGQQPVTVNHYNLLASGANGLITDDPAGMVSLLGTAFPPDRVTLLRRPLVIGHRGIPELAPENTLEGARLALQHGADLIENDVHLSADAEVIVHHDETLERTTTGSGPLASRTLGQLSEYRANLQFPARFPGARIPTLRQYLQEFADKDMVHVIEIKTGDPDVVEPVARLVSEFAAEDQVVFISFQHDQLPRLQAALPGSSVGCLTYGQMNEDHPLRSVRLVLELVQPLNATYNPNTAGLGPRFLEAAKHRGITTWPWTFREYDHFVEMFLAGLNGLTTDASSWSSDWVANVSVPATVEAVVDRPARLVARVSSQDRTTSEQTPELVVLAGHEVVNVTGDELTGVQPGTAWLAARVWQDLGQGRGYFMNSEAVKVQVAAADT